MTNIVRYRPFNDFRSMHRTMNRLWDGASLELPRYQGAIEGPAPVDIMQTDDDVIVKATLPGVAADDIHVSVTGKVLTIKGEVTELKETEAEESDEQPIEYFVRERRYSGFSRRLALPTLVDADKATAEVENGVLTLTLPKADEVKPRRIEIKSK